MAGVVNIGSGNTRIGIGGRGLPDYVIESIVESSSTSDDDSATHASVRPIVKGIPSDWDAVERLWEKIYKEDERLTDLPIITTDSPTITDRDRGKMAEIMFEKFNVPAYFVGSEAVCSLYSVGRTSGIVVDAGYGVTHAMAIHEGFAFPHTIGQLDLGGSDIDRNLMELLNDRNITTDVKSPFGGRQTATDIINTQGKVAYDYASEALALRLKPKTAPTYTLPDGTELQLESEHIRAPEAFLQPALAGCRGTGLAEMLWDITETCDADREGGPMRSLTQFVLLVGGCSMIPGLPERLKKEIDAKCHTSRAMYITGMPIPERHHAAWVGASILAQLPQFVENNFVHKAEYAEDGVAAVNKRCC